MNNNVCIFCGVILPEGRQVCYKCENMTFGAYSVTPENRFCVNCKKEKCNGECAEFLEFQKKLKRKKKKELSQKTTKIGCIIKATKKGG